MSSQKKETNKKEYPIKITHNDTVVERFMRGDPILLEQSEQRMNENIIGALVEHYSGSWINYSLWLSVIPSNQLLRRVEASYNCQSGLVWSTRPNDNIPKTRFVGDIADWNNIIKYNAALDAEGVSPIHKIFRVWRRGNEYSIISPNSIRVDISNDTVLIHRSVSKGGGMCAECAVHARTLLNFDNITPDQLSDQERLFVYKLNKTTFTPVPKSLRIASSKKDGFFEYVKIL